MPLFFQEFKGNSDQSSIVRHWLKPHMYVTDLLWYPTSYVGQLCLNVEIYGCRASDISMLDTVFFTLSMFAAFKDCKKRCDAPFSRCVNNNRSEEECECIQECPKVMKEVCGSDNVTYDNECLLKKAACKKNTEIKIKEKGSCTVRFYSLATCMSSLGLENRQIRDKQISASSELDKHHTAKQGRVSLISSPQDSSWCSASTLDMGTQYLQVDLLSVHALSGFSTQGAVTEKFWVSRYLVRYSLDGTDWILIEEAEETYKNPIDGRSKQFQGNTNQSSIVYYWLKTRLDARFVRFSPTSFFGQRCMRIELYGCKKSHVYPDEGKISYNFLPFGILNAVSAIVLKIFLLHCHLSGCKGMCSAPFSRCVKHKGNERKCECIQECPNAVKQVCASDNVTYDNECLLKKTACEKGEELTLVKNGNCAGI
ncbi:unnamed protein product, partial [Pocillopora meandrina]